ESAGNFPDIRGGPRAISAGCYERFGRIRGPPRSCPDGIRRGVAVDTRAGSRPLDPDGTLRVRMVVDNSDSAGTRGVLRDRVQPILRTKNYRVCFRVVLPPRRWPGIGVRRLS